MDALAEKLGVGRTLLVAQIKVIRGSPDLVRHGVARKGNVPVKVRKQRIRARASG